MIARAARELKQASKWNGLRDALDVITAADGKQHAAEKRQLADLEMLFTQPQRQASAPSRSQRAHELGGVVAALSSAPVRIAPGRFGERTQ